MSAAINLVTYSDVRVVLGTAGLVMRLVRRLGFSPVPGYLAAGALPGPLGLGELIGQMPLLHRVTVVDADNVAAIGDLGVVFLLCVIGVELSYERLMSLRRLVFGLGGLADSGLDRADQCSSRPLAAVFGGPCHPWVVPCVVFHCHRDRGSGASGPVVDRRGADKVLRCCWRKIWP